MTNAQHTNDQTADTTFDWDMDMNNNDYGSIFYATHESISCLTKVAANPSVPASILEQMVYHPALKVRVALATNINAPADALEILTQDIHLEVRLALASNKFAPIEVLKQLISDESSYVSVRALGTLERIGNAAGAISINRKPCERKLHA